MGAVKPTAQQITTASRLQELGVGQGAKEWIVKTTSTFEVWGSKPEFPEGWAGLKLIGPIPSAAECWVEILELCKDDSFEPRVVFIGKTEWQLMRFIELDDNGACSCPDMRFNSPAIDLDEAFRQALITMAAQ